MSMQSKPSRRRRRPDPFQLLAVISIVLGMLIVIASVVFWMLTGKQSSLFVMTGVGLTVGGPMSSKFQEGARKLADLLEFVAGDDDSEPEPPERSEPPPAPRRPERRR